MSFYLLKLLHFTMPNLYLYIYLSFLPQGNQDYGKTKRVVSNVDFFHRKKPPRFSEYICPISMGGPKLPSFLDYA